MKALRIRLTPLLVAIALMSPAARAKNKHAQHAASQPQEQPQDGITVEAHIPLPQGAITGFILTRHYDRRYAYAQRAAGQPPVLIDITKLDSPKVLATVSAAGDAGSGDLVAVAGTTVVERAAAPAADTPKPQTIRIIDYSDTAHPKVTKEFDGVTAISNHDGVILLANPDGIWILSQKLADDPDGDEQYAKKVIYGESRY